MNNTSKNALTVVLSNSVEEIRALVAQGYCPVECAIGGDSIMDSLMMDHHGPNSGLEAVSVRAYRDLFGKRADDPRFVLCGVADADAAFAICCLAGIVPHPSRVIAEGTAPAVKASLTRNLSPLAETIARVDVSPIGLDIPSLPFGEMLLTWNAMNVSARDTLGAYTAVGLWRALLEGNPVALAPFMEAAKVAEVNRRQASLADLKERGELVEGVLVIIGSRVFGFPEWYQRVETNPFEAVSGWKAPVVLAWLENNSNVTIGCPNQQVAETLFGPGGLKNVLPQLQPAGWGGREAVGGSPRGAKLTVQDVREAAKKVASLIRH